MKIRTLGARLLLGAWVALTLTTPARGDEPPSSPSKNLPSSVPARLDQLAWMAGSWGAPAESAEVEEVWLAPKGGLMLGLGRTVKDGKAVDFEFMRIEQKGDSLVYLASPRARAETPFPLASLDASTAVFESTLEFPRRVVYRKNADGTLTARIEGTRNGQPAAREWTWRKKD